MNDGVPASCDRSWTEARTSFVPSAVLSTGSKLDMERSESGFGSNFGGNMGI